jgi:hypothetical protein
VQHEDQQPDGSGPYAVAAGTYWSAGWRGVLPLPAGAKFPPPKDWTGADAPWPSYPDLQAWIDENGAGNIGLRVPEHVLGIDVDDYNAKGGGATLAAKVEQYGPLPATWTSSARDGISGIRFFRIPVGLAWPGVLGPGIELVQYRHRYAVCWPSINPETGTVYRWQRPDGVVAEIEVPEVDELPDLPATWVTGITSGELERHRASLDLGPQQCGAWLEATGAGPECRAVARAAQRYIADLAGRTMARHDIGVQATARLTLLAAEGHTGALDALRRFHQAWTAAVLPDRGEQATAAEWGRLIDGAVQIAAAKPSGERALGDPCLSPLLGGAPASLIPAPRSPGVPSAPEAAAVLAPPPGPFPGPLAGVLQPPPVGPSLALTAAGPGVPAALPLPPPPMQTMQMPHPLQPVQQSPAAQLTAAPPAEPTEEEIEQARARQFEGLVDQEVLRGRVRDEARRRLRVERVEGAPEAVDLGELLSAPDPLVNYRIEGLWTRHGRVLLTAAFKAGKSTLVQNVLRGLADGGDLLGKHEVHQVERRVVLIDNELDVDELRLWLREQGIKNTDRVSVISLRGKVATFDPIDEHVRSEWAKKLAAQEADVVILDCLRPVLDALGLDEHTQAGTFLTAFDALLDEAGVGEAIVVHHAGHEGERARGDSRLRDWPDQEWRIVREKGEGDAIDPSKPRFFAAYGRRVDVPEGQLDYSPSDRRLFYAGGSRADSKLRYALKHVIDVLTEARENREPGLSQNEILRRLAECGEPRRAIQKALETAVQRRIVRQYPGERRAVLHELMTPDRANGEPGADGHLEGNGGRP